MTLAQRSTELLVELGLLADGEPAEVTPLAGGVSSDIASVTTASGDFCVKFALERLKVAETWTAPVRRNAAEYDWLTYVAAIDPALVPRLIGRSARLGGFAMAFLDPRTHTNWKSESAAWHCRRIVCGVSRTGDRTNPPTRGSRSRRSCPFRQSG